MDRRNFLISSAAALGASSSVFGAASDTVRVAVVGIGGRARDHIAGLIREPNVEIVAICDPDDSHLDRGAKTDCRGQPEGAPELPRRSQAARGQIHRRHHHRRTEPLAHADGGVGVPGGQGRLRGKTVLAQYVRGQTDCGRGAPVQPHRAARQPDPLFGRGPGSHAKDERRVDRRRLPGARAVLQMARHDWPHARFSGARGSRLRPVDRPRTQARIHPQTAFTTTGTTSGTPATATWATRAFTSSMSRAGVWACATR